jgi:hypothetical protein
MWLQRTRLRVRATRLALSVSVAALLALVAALPAAAAVPGATADRGAAPAADVTTPLVGLQFGASSLTGQIIWSNRSVQIGATLKAVSAAKQAEFGGFNGGDCVFDETRFAAAGTSRGIGFTETCDQAGGFGEIDVFLEDGTGTNALHEDVCFRTGCMLVF